MLFDPSPLDSPSLLAPYRKTTGVVFPLRVTLDTFETDGIPEIVVSVEADSVLTWLEPEVRLAIVENLERLLMLDEPYEVSVEDVDDNA